MIDLKVLRQIPLFADLRDEQLDFAQLGCDCSLQPGEILAVEGEPSGYFWVLLSGEIQCTKQVGDRHWCWSLELPAAAAFFHCTTKLEK
jgi:signal-transduction protein with cAMP-binding, CBS, and nucleotidyltransferase domain